MSQAARAHGGVFSGILKSMGIVFGDIGTSPIYTLTVVFLLLPPTPQNVIGVLSLIFWTLIVLVTMEYAWLAMSLSKRGEGGTIVLRELLLPHLKSARQATLVTVLTFVGISLLIGDGVITPAISILSAVEGMKLIPGFGDMHQGSIIAIAAVIAIVLFSFQRGGTERVAFAFGPLMVVWFSALALSGLICIAQTPQVLVAINPWSAASFMWHQGWAGFLVLSEVILCATGGEALYADMGHLGRKPILHAWYVVFVALVINYFGQGAYAIAHPETKSVLFEMVYDLAPSLYVPFLLLSIMATVIASQAMISGIFSVIYQGITTSIMPIFKVDYTSKDLRSQIYIGTANWFLLGAVLFVMYEFGESAKLAAAYGLAVTGTMTLTGIMMTWIFAKRNHMGLAVIAAFVTLADVLYLGSNMLKIPHGGYWSLVIAALPLGLIVLYTTGQRKLFTALKPMKIEEFKPIFDYRYQNEPTINGTALFFTRYTSLVPPFIYNTMFMNGIVYEDNVIVSMQRRDDPFGVIGLFRDDLTDGFRHFELQYGYMELFDVEAVLRENGIYEKTIFYGIEDIITENPLWRLFGIIKKLSPTFVQFYKLPSHKLHGVVTRVEM